MAAVKLLLLASLLAQAPPEVCYVRHFAEARYRAYGYDHIVHIHSECDFPIACVVRTDVNPDPLNVDVPARGQVEVLTWRASPSRVFSASLACEPLSGNVGGTGRGSLGAQHE